MHDTGCLVLVHWDDPEGWDEREVGGGFRMGNTSTPVADSCQCMAKPIQYCKVISLQFKKKKVVFTNMVCGNLWRVCLRCRSEVREDRASQVVLVVKNLLSNAGDKRCGFNPWIGKIP